ncbi:uncharacterized protein TNCT_514071 [Trichonephila clavata]|uniref:Uncharacterized protein n=1 Tax=Trichonephila clavata TaxID=2740835 RepID=A0A8X6GQR7_TRICU|nr:uncharacterized protein TNCT_514071 [Trichonephila clavata]
MHGNKILIKLLALQYEIQDERYGMMVIFAGQYMFLTLRVQYPCLVALSICVLVNNYRILLLRIINGFKKMEFCAIPEDVMKLRNDYNNIEIKLYNLKDALSAPLFVILLISFCDLYAGLSTILYKRVSTFFLVQLGCNVLPGVAIILFVTLFNARIPASMMRIKTTVAFLRDKYEFGSASKGKEMLVFNRIIKKDIVYLSAGGIVDFKKRFLVTAFGAMLSYGVLIISFK